MSSALQAVQSLATVQLSHFSKKSAAGNTEVIGVTPNKPFCYEH